MIGTTCTDARRARDLRRAAVHEHCHASVARHFGIDCHVRIDPNPAGGDEEMYFDGRCYIDMPDFNALDEGDRRLILAAGTVGEVLDEDPDVAAWQIAEWLDDEVLVLSDTDARLGTSFCEIEIERVLTLLRTCWPEVLQRVEWECRAYEIEASR